MPVFRACPAQVLYDRARDLDRKVIAAFSPHQALLLRERMYSVLSAADRIRTANSRRGVFSAETVETFETQTQEMLRHLGIEIER